MILELATSQMGPFCIHVAATLREEYTQGATRTVENVISVGADWNKACPRELIF